jgi:hypothetical protein
LDAIVICCWHIFESFMNLVLPAGGTDGIEAPWICCLVGRVSAIDWVDEESRYTSNEITINWQAALVYLLAGFIDK